MKRCNKKNRIGRNAEYNLSRYAFEDIFGNGSVNIKKIKEFKSDVEGFRKIDQAVCYAKTKDREFRNKYLNRVKATKSEYDNKIKMCINNDSFFAYILAIIATTELIYKFTNSNIVENIGFWLVASALLFIIWGVLLMFDRKFKKYNKIIKYLTYLEQQLGLDK